MKKINSFGNEKLRLKKKAIANLSKPDMAQVQGGEAAFTTSYGKCTGIFCCNRLPQSMDIMAACFPDMFADGVQLADDIK